MNHIQKYSVLYILLALAVGVFVGTQWNTWFPASNGTGTVGGKQNACGSKDSMPCGDLPNYKWSVSTNPRTQGQCVCTAEAPETQE